MSRCQHNQRITKFCITPSCTHPHCGGCQYCFKRYHCHIGEAKFIKESQVCDLVKYLTSCQDKKPKIRPLKQSIYNYFNIVKGQISTYLDCLSSDLLNKISYPYIEKQGHLNVFKKLKHKQYNKLTTEEMIRMVDFKNQNDPKKLQKNQVNEYIIKSKEVYNKINAINNLYKEFQKQASQSYLGETIMSVSIFYKKISEIYQFIENQTSVQEQYVKNSLRTKKQEIVPPPTLITQKKNHVGLLPQLKTRRSQQPGQRQVNKETSQIERRFQGAQKTQVKTITSDSARGAGMRQRKVSIDSRCSDFLVKSRLKTYQEKEKEISQRKKKLQEMMIYSQRKKQPQNVQSSGSSIQNKNQQGYYSENQSAVQSLKNKGIKQKGNDMIPHTNLPPGKQEKRLYQEQQSVEKKTYKIPVNVIQQNAQDQQCQSPILRLKKGAKPPPTSGSTGFQLGLFKVQQTPTQQTHSEPLDKQLQTQVKSSSQESSDKQNIRPLTPHIKPQQLNVSDKEANSLFLLIESLKLSGKKAIPLLQAALKYAPHNFSAVEYLTFLLLEQNRPKQCLKVCNQAIKLIAGQPNCIEISFHLFNNKAAALNMLGRFSQSIPILEGCLEVKKKDVLYKNLGDAYFNLGIIEKAVINYQNAVILNDENHEAFYNLAVCLYTQKNYESSKLKVQRALMIDQKNQNYIELYKQIANVLKAS